MLFIYTTNYTDIYNYIKICINIYNLLPRYLQFYTSHSKCRFFIPTGFYKVNKENTQTYAVLTWKTGTKSVALVTAEENLFACDRTYFKNS